MRGAPEQELGFDELLEYLKVTRGFDFTGYKPPGLVRRIRKRLQLLGVAGFTEYQDYLEVHPEEFVELFNYVLINVTSFFRDPLIWDYVASEIVPLLAERALDNHLRVWSAGCASGEEAYTLAMLLAEGLGRKVFSDHVKIFATDLDEETLTHARAATYPESKLEDVPPALRDKYFQPAGDHGGFVFDKELRRCVIFGRHNLVEDAPISRVDLLTCRNTLMYLNANTQAQVLNSLHFGLSDDGFLILGTAEMLFTRAGSFSAVDLKRRVFRKVPGAEHRVLLAPHEGGYGNVSLDSMAANPVFRASPLAQIILTREGALVGANPRAREVFGLRDPDIGRPLRDLEVYYRPVDLAARLQDVLDRRLPVRVEESRLNSGPADITHVSTELTPIFAGGADVSGVLISYMDISRMKRIEDELQATSQELATALEELQSTNEELETTNEELQSTNEELETTNEELQSTNEELETTNEELQSTNEELRALNEEALRRGEEVSLAGAFISSVLEGLGSAVISLDSDLRIAVWNGAAEDLWGVRSDEAAGALLTELDIGLPVEQLIPLLVHVLSGDAEREQSSLEAVNRRGRAIRCRVSVAPLRDPVGRVVGAILLMQDQTAETS